MNYIKYTLSFLLLLVLFSACRKEDDLTADFEVSGPYPAIEEGTTEASQIRYGIYEDYDIHIYYDLSGEEAMTTFGSTFNFYYSVPDSFIGLSAGNYYDELSENDNTLIRISWWATVYYEEEAIAAGFVHTSGTYAKSSNPYQDWLSYVVWIISRPKEREIFCWQLTLYFRKNTM